MLSLVCGGAGRKQLYTLASIFLHDIVCNQVKMKLFQVWFVFIFHFSFLQMVQTFAKKIPSANPGGGRKERTCVPKPC